MKRQIIKTRPVAPYRAARIAIAVIIVALLGAFAYFEFWPRQHAGHTSLAPQTTVRQDSAIFLRNSQSPTDLLS
jgi:hypothetical protein